MKIVEAFSGIGSQVKALKNIGVEYELVANIDWDINAIIAYDIIHNKEQNTEEYKKYSKEELIDEMKNYSFSFDGKVPYEEKQLKNTPREVLERALFAIKRCNNLVSIVDVKGEDIPSNIDLFTYSFPCQDLSVAGSWHGKITGIDRNVKNRSGMLWEVERILKEMTEQEKELPKFLLMENVSNLLSRRHSKNFEEWKDFLKELGYINEVYVLNAKDFGIPQNRERVFMLSVQTNYDSEKKDKITKFLNENNLNDKLYVENVVKDKKTVQDILKLDYSIEKYRLEANSVQPNDTESRRKIFEENDKLFDGKEFAPFIKTITTKQDRNPNSGVIFYERLSENKSSFRYLTPRECFLFMGFDEEDYEILIKNDFPVRKNSMFFNESKLYKMAGNSIVVKVLEYIFKNMIQIDELLRPKNK